jgi:hypothetical protein
MLIQPREILDLIAEVGQPLQLCDRSTLAPAQPEYGFPAQQSYSCRKVQGYIVPIVQGFLAEQLASITPLETGKLNQGDLVAYIAGTDLAPDSLTDQTTLVVDRLTYQVQYLRSIYHQGKTLLHLLRLTQTQAQTQI